MRADATSPLDINADNDNQRILCVMQQAEERTTRQSVEKGEKKQNRVREGKRLFRQRDEEGSD